MKQFFKALAVNEMRTFGIILARMIPMQAELREADLPEDIIKFMPPIDAKTIDPDEMEENPYDDPELDVRRIARRPELPPPFTAHGRWTASKSARTAGFRLAVGIV
jgi:hypothetical protein